LEEQMLGALVATAAFAISSPAFTEGGNIPSKFTCDAGATNPSPALAWKEPPANAKSFVLIMHDPDAPLAGGFTHWVLFDIPATTMSLPENFQPGSVGTSGNSGFRRAGYGGPCPPSGSHHYHFMLSALDVPSLGLPAGATKADVEKAMQGHVIGMAETVGVYQRQPK
jgi:Raf kinase inhibitor-like YbhB/YbcL family protein